MHIFNPDSFVDIIHTNRDKIWHAQRIQLHVKLPGRAVDIVEPWTFYTTEKMFFYQEMSNEAGDKTYEIQEFNYNGKLMYSYSIDSNDVGGYFERVSKQVYFMLMPLDHKVQRQALRLTKGKNIPDFEFLDCGGIESPIKRFGFLAIPMINKTLDGEYKFIASDLHTNEEIMQCQLYDIPSDHEVQYSTLNWNISELGMLVLPKYTGKRRTLLFNFCRTDIIRRKMSLKYLAGRAVLMLFSEGSLLKQNIPSCLFDYLGVV